MNAFLQTLRNLGPARLAAIVVVTASLLGFFGFIMTRINTSPLALLYSNLDTTDAGAIVQKLDAMKIPYEVDASGNLIRVPADQVGKVRMMLSADDLPKGGSVGYEIFDQKEGFGTTSFVQDIDRLRALEGELARTIGSLDPVKSARVQLVLPQRELFSHGTQTATASVFLNLRGGVTLTREQVAAIQHLIAASVPQLQPNEVSIVDQHGNLLAHPTDDSAAGAAESQDGMRAQFERNQAHKIEDLLSQTLGYGKVRAQVSADLDFDRISTSSEIFDPDSQVVRSTQTTDDSSTNTEGGNNQAVTVTNNLPATPGAPVPAPAAAPPVNKTSHSEQTTNYEIDKTMRNQVRESGQVRRLSVAVVVDGTYAAGKDGKQAYTPRSAEEMAKIKSLVESAVNYDPARGDTVDVVNMQFVQPEAPAASGSSASDMLAGIPKTDLFHMIETLILAVIGFLVVLLVVRPIMKKILESATMAGGEQGLLAAGAYGGTAQLPPPAAAAANRAAENVETESEIDRMIDISRVEGRVKASSLRKVGEIVDKHPDEAVSILRNWMYQETR